MIEENKKFINHSKMPMDYESYLLSASPPGFEVQYKNYMMLQESLDLSGLRRSNGYCRRLRDETHEIDLSNCSDSDSFVTPGGINGYDREYSSRLKTYEDSRTTKSKKTVSFADENGLQLSQVRIITESPNSPPRLRRSFLASLANDATPNVTATPPLVLKFVQPAANYISFREKLDTNNVSLENVILKDFAIVGTIKVKNIAFEKSVKVRYTYDSWNSFHDEAATFVQINLGSAPFDTFSFEVNIPTTYDRTKSIEFVVGFSANNNEFWDNNSGENYKIASTDSSSPVSDSTDKTDQPVFQLDYEQTEWTQFSSWSYADNSIPYY